MSHTVVRRRRYSANEILEKPFIQDRLHRLGLGQELQHQLATADLRRLRVPQTEHAATIHLASHNTASQRTEALSGPVSYASRTAKSKSAVVLHTTRVHDTASPPKGVTLRAARTTESNTLPASDVHDNYLEAAPSEVEAHEYPRHVPATPALRPAASNSLSGISSSSNTTANNNSANTI